MKQLSIIEKSAIFLGGLLIAVTIGWLDYMTGEHSDFFLLYYFPIAAAAWWIGWRAGVSMALLCVASWTISDVMAASRILLLVEEWDTAMRLLAFLSMVILLEGIRRKLRQSIALNAELKTAMSEIKRLEGILPMCRFCRKIRGADNQWISLERYIGAHSDATIRQGMCPECYRKHFGQPDGT